MKSTSDTQPTLYSAFQLARLGDGDRLARLLDAGVPAGLADDKGDSLLMLAAYHGHARVVRMLVARGADPDRRNACGLSPLDGAAFLGDREVLRALVDAGVDVNAASSSGRSALMWAAAFQRVGAVHDLLAAGADAGKLDEDGRSALDHAIAMGANDTVALLEARAVA